MKKALLFLLLLATALQMRAAVGHGYIVVCQQNDVTDSIAVHGSYDIRHSKLGLDGVEHGDFVTLVVTTAEGEWRFAINDELRVYVPELRPWDRLTLTGDINLLASKTGRKNIIFDGTFPRKTGSTIVYKWQTRDSVYIHMAEQKEWYKTGMDTLRSDSITALFKTIEVEKKESPIYVFYPGQDAVDYNHVNIARVQTQQKVNNTEHIGHSGDCASSPATYTTVPFPDLTDENVYTFTLKHHPAFFTFLTHNPRLPSVKLDSVVMIADKHIAGHYKFNYEDGILLDSVTAPHDTITLQTPFFSDNGWKHTPRNYENSQDSTAAFMVVAPVVDANFKFIFHVRDTLSLIDTTFVKSYQHMTLKPNTFYTVNAEVPDTLFSIVDLGLGDIKYAFRNVEAYFERGPVSFYGGAFSYGESKTKDDYGLGDNSRMDNTTSKAITNEFIPTDSDKGNGDAAYQRWGGCWRLPQNEEIDTLLKYCKTEWTEYNGTEGALITGPSGRRIFLPVSDLSSNYWSIDRSKQIEDFRYWVPDPTWGGHYVYRDIPILGISKERDSTAFHNTAKFYDPGFARGVIEYSNYIKSSTDYDGSLMLLRHIGEAEASGGNFSINGMVRSARPWPKASTVVQLQETGFIFGTDSATLYYNKDVDREWADTLFSTGPGVNFDNGEHIKLRAANNVGVAPYVDLNNQQPTNITVQLSGKNFLGYLDKEKKYYVREYFRMWNPDSARYDYYYASKATQVKGFFPHTDSIRWVVNEKDATVNGFVVGVSAEVAGKVGFVIQEFDKSKDEFKRIKSTEGGTEHDVWWSRADSIYHNLTIQGSGFFLADNGGVGAPGDVRTDMTFSYTIPKLDRSKYYFARAVFATFTKEGDEVKDTTFLYAPEVSLLQPLDTVDLGVGYGVETRWASLDVEGQFPEDRDSTYLWDSDRQTPLPDVIADIGGTSHDIVFRKWYGDDGWVFTMPSKDQLEELLQNCDFTYMDRFDRQVLKVDGPNGNYMFLTDNHAVGYYEVHDYKNLWTSTRTGNSAYYNSDGQDLSLSPVSNLAKYFVRPVLQTNAKLNDGSLLFIQTDTVARSSKNRGEMLFYGRALGVTPDIKDNYTVTRGFVLHDFKGGELGDEPCGVMPDTTTLAGHSNDGRYNGLYSVPLSDEIRDTLRSDKDYWYRAYINFKNNETDEVETYYGVPRKLSPLVVEIDSIFWEVHENHATLGCKIDGTVFIRKTKLEKLLQNDGLLDIASTTGTKLGFIVGDSANISLQNYESLWEYPYKENEEITDSSYRAPMSVPKDTVYWVRAYIVCDNMIRYSEPRQFGLDYVDLGLPSHRLWANISVGSAYPEDDHDYFSLGEPSPKSGAQSSYNSHSWGEGEGAYNYHTYVVDTLRFLRYNHLDDHSTTTSTKTITLEVPNPSGTLYNVPYRGAIRELSNCTYYDNNIYWKHYSGTKNDAAYMNWQNSNPLFENTEKYIPNNLYGDLFVEPNNEEWQELQTLCGWKYETVFGVPGWRVTGPNGNSLFLPLKGRKESSYAYDTKKSPYLMWTTDTARYHAQGYYHVADSIRMMKVTTTEHIFDSPGDYELTWGQFYNGFGVRPIARYNLTLSKGADKLRDDTLAYLKTDTVTYVNYRTSVALQGTYRINYPIASDQYELGFVVSDCSDAEKNDITIHNCQYTTLQKLRNASQYFVVLDNSIELKNGKGLESDKTYFYRFFLHTKKDDVYYYADADSFHLADYRTEDVTWRMYETKATIRGLVQGVMKAEAQSEGFKAALIVSNNRDLEATDNDLLQTFDLTSQLTDFNGSKGGPVTATFTLPKDSTYYYRLFVYYNGKYHYGDVNLFGFELVDLSLPSGKKWASINVGGANPLKGISTTAISESHGVSNQDQPTRRAGSGSRGIKGSGDAEDWAQTYWHGVYRMPYGYEAQELIDNCTWTADTIFGQPGVRVTGENGRSIFLRHSQNYYSGNKLMESDTDYSLSHNYLDIEKNNDTDPKRHKGRVSSIKDHSAGCQGVYFERPIWESNILLNPDGNRDHLLIRTDDAIVHSQVNYVTFFGSFIGTDQQRFGGSKYNINSTNSIQHCGFIVGSDTLVTHEGDGSVYRKYDFPHTDVRSDSIFYYDRQNINIFKIDSTYWVRAYVKIDDAYYYGRSIKFIRQPNITTEDVEWAVGKTKATLRGSVIGFNNDDDVSTVSDDSEELQAMEELAKNARVGIIVGFNDDLTEADVENGAKLYDLGHAVNGAFQVEVPYDRDTTYYYRAYIYYSGHYVFAKHTNHYGLEFVDLGLPMLWANLNVGARFAEDEADSRIQLFSWGDTIPNRKPYTFGNYPYYYATGDDEYNNLGNEIKGSKYDVAHVKWNYTWDTDTYGGRGSLWAMPSEEDLQMLVDSCVWERYSSKGNFGEYVAGYKVTGKNGNSIFISNKRIDEYTISGNHYYDRGPWDYGPLWTSSRAPRERNAFSIQAGTANRLMKYHYRYHGHMVRPMAHINAGSSERRYSIMTERTNWVAGVKSATIYGCVLGLNDTHKGTYGFVVGATSDVTKANADHVYTIRTATAEEGLFSQSLTSLSNNRMYYFRAFLDVDGKTYYGEVKEFGIVMVDLGLPSGTKWANVNMGSWKEKDHGDYYGWGETTSKDVFTTDGYKYYSSTTGSYRDLGNNISGNDTTDVANKQLGGRWRMAGDEEWNELMARCTWTPDTVAHVPGFRVTGANGNSIFLPANYYNPSERDANYDLGTNENGDSSNNHDDEVPHRGYYWSSNRSSDYRKAREVLFIDSVPGKQVAPQFIENFRYRGNSIRPVASANRDNFYLRTDATDWRYKRDTINFYAVILFDENRLPDGYEAGFVLGTSPDITLATAGVETVKAKPSVIGSGDYVGVYMGDLKEDSRIDYEGNKHNDGVWYYRAYVKPATGEPWYGDSRQFGLEPVDLGFEGLQWANINVDAASPEDIGLNGTPVGKYYNVDPAYAEFGGLWQMPSDDVKLRLLDENEFNWTETTLYGTQMWKVSPKSDDSKFIYLMSKDPALWGYRAIAQSNLKFDDEKTAFLRTDSTSWRAGYADNTLYATLVIADTAAIAERGFVLGSTPDVTLDSDPVMVCIADREAGQIGTSSFFASMGSLPVGTYYYRAYVKYKTDNKYYYVEPSDAKEVGIDFVDLRLPSGVKWANVNLGATVATDLGDNYAWGDTQRLGTFTRDNYRYYDPNVGYTDIGADISADTKYDVTALKIEGTRMPSLADLEELISECNWAYDAEKNGFTVTSSDGVNSIFLPLGDYWTATQFVADNSKAWSLSEYLNNRQLTVAEKRDALRYLGKMIRPVQAAVTTKDATSRTASTAVLNGVISSAGFTSRGFEYARSAAELENEATKWVVKADAGSELSFSKQVGELSEGSIYYYRAFVVIDDHTYYGTVKSFTTMSSEGMKAVDLGLSVKWADRNVGSDMPESDGSYYAWGDPKTHPTYSKTTYQHYVDAYVNIGTDVSASPWDVATANFGSCWRMPTQAEVQELINNCTWTWATKEGVPGYWVENVATHQIIFLPAAGYRDLTYLYNNDLWGHYWASTVNGSATSSTAIAMSFDATRRLNSGTTIDGSKANLREYGFSVRPVYDTNGAVDGQDVFIRTDSITYSGNRQSNTLYGTMLGLLVGQDDLTQGFVIGTTRDVDLSTTVLSDVSQTATANGSYHISLTDKQLRSLTVGDAYYVRAYVLKNGDAKYGDAVEMTDYTFFTDSVKWSLGNSGTLYGHVKARKPETGLEVGFRFSTTSGAVDGSGRLTTATTMVATFDATDSVFTSTLQSVKVATYYYQAYTLYDGVYHYGEVKSFGAKVVDLGLPSGVKWVDMNLGADHEENPGDIYRWGDTEPGADGDYTVPADRTFIGGTALDAAHVRLDTGYRMPSATNIQELIDECEWQWEANGFRITSKHNGKSIFLPVGRYWASQAGSTVPAGSAAILDASTASNRVLRDMLRTTGLWIRPTLNPNPDMYSEGGNAGVGTIGGGIVEE